MYVTTSLPTELYPQPLMAQFKYLFILFYLHVRMCARLRLFVCTICIWSPLKLELPVIGHHVSAENPTPALYKHNKCSIFAAEFSLQSHPLYGSFLM